MNFVLGQNVFVSITVYFLIISLSNSVVNFFFQLDAFVSYHFLSVANCPVLVNLKFLVELENFEISASALQVRRSPSELQPPTFLLLFNHTTVGLHCQPLISFRSLMTTSSLSAKRLPKIRSPSIVS